MEGCAVDLGPVLGIEVVKSGLVAVGEALQGGGIGKGVDGQRRCFGTKTTISFDTCYRLTFLLVARRTLLDLGALVILPVAL